MTAKGLRNKRGDPIHPSTLADLLANRVYVGVVSRNGLNVHGSREALVDPLTFEHVRQVLATNRNAEVRTRLHPHYLRGCLFCHSCNSRFSDSYARGKQYRYFFCLGRHRRRTECDEPSAPVDEIEKQIETAWWTVNLTEPAKHQLCDDIQAEIEHRLSDRNGRDAVRQQIADLVEERRRLLRLAIKQPPPLGFGFQAPHIWPNQPFAAAHPGAKLRQARPAVA